MKLKTIKNLVPENHDKEVNDFLNNDNIKIIKIENTCGGNGNIYMITYILYN